MPHSHQHRDASIEFMSAANTPSVPAHPPASSQPVVAESPAAPGSQQPRSYAHATRHSVSATAPAVVTPQHAKADSVNTTSAATTMAAQPGAVASPTGPQGSGHEHSRKPSVTYSASGSSGQMPNGAPPASTARPNAFHLPLLKYIAPKADNSFQSHGNVKERHASAGS